MVKSSFPNTVLPRSYFHGRNFSDFVTARILNITEDGRQSQFCLSIGTVFTCSYGDVLIPSGSLKRSCSNQSPVVCSMGVGPFLENLREEF